MGAERIATSVVLTRGRGAELEVLLVERAPELSFFGGYHAFPGGVVEEVDLEDGPDGDATHRRCALRELFEEAGVLVARAPDGKERAAWRERLVARGPAPADWRSFLDGCAIDRDAVLPFARLTTPDFVPLRYRTRFVHAELPRGEALDLRPGELTGGRFWRPREAREAWLRGVLLIVPPTLFLLELLEETGEPARFRARAGAACAELEAGKLHRIRNTPGILLAPLRTPTIPPATTTNCYVVGEELLYVVDPATWEEQERARLVQHLDERLDAGARLAGVLVTHHHRDHVGSVAAIAGRYSLPVHAHPLTLERLPQPPRDGRPLGDGAELELGTAPDGSADWRLRALHTPGHDRGHLCFVESRYGALIAGDLVSTLSTIVIDPPEGHLATYLASLERLRVSAIGMLYPAHGPPARDGRAMLDEYLAHRARREARIVAVLEEGFVAEEELLARVYDDVVPEMRGLAARSLAAGLEKLAEEGRAAREGGRWRLVVAAPRGRAN